jgi:hypothetical protein
MAKALVSDDRWAAVEPPLPPYRPKPKSGPPPALDHVLMFKILLLQGGVRAVERAL